MKKIFAAVMFLFLLISTKNVCALTFQAGTSFYDFKAQNSNTFQRLNYPAVDCTNKTYCYFNTNFSGVAGTIDYVSFQAFVKNDFVPDNTQTFSFNYHLVMNYTEPQLYPAFTNLNSQVAITAVGLSNKFACNTNYSSVSLSSVAIDGTCQVEINNPGHFDNLIINWSSNSFNDVPSTDPLLVYNPNHPISMHWTTESTLYNFNFAISPTQDNLDKINNNLVDINQNLDDLNKSVADIKNFIDDDNVDSAKDNANDYFSTFQTDTFGLTSVITAPLNLIKSITSSTCSPLVLQVPFLNTRSNDFALPCLSSIYSNFFGSFFDIYQTCTTGLIAYWVCVKIFNLVKDFKNPDHDEIEVLDL